MRPCFWKDERQLQLWQRWSKARQAWREASKQVFYYLHRLRPPRSAALNLYQPDPRLLRECSCSPELVQAAEEFLNARREYMAEVVKPCATQPCPHCEPSEEPRGDPPLPVPTHAPQVPTPSTGSWAIPVEDAALNAPKNEGEP